MGGKVALKGTDGAHTLSLALKRGAHPVSPDRALAALSRLVPLKEKFDLITPGGIMGEDILKKTDLCFTVLDETASGTRTCAQDTIRAVQSLERLNIDLLVFAGGDGTASDICRALALPIPVIGIPSGVKMHSSVFGINPERAGDLIALFAGGQSMEIQDAEIIDMDESALRKGKVCTRLAGYLKTPFKRSFSQSPKAGSPLSEKTSFHAIARQIFSLMKTDVAYLIGPGTTLMPLATLLGFEGTLLGFDLVINQTLVQKDLTETDILRVVKNTTASLVLTPIGGQGYLLGRGNQQISPRVLNHIRRDAILIGATSQKLASFQGRPLLVDTGCRQTNDRLQGYAKVITGQDEVMVLKIEG